MPDARLFEMGSVYELSGGERVEPKRACLGATAAAVREFIALGGGARCEQGRAAAAAEAFRGFKGDVENLLAAFAGDSKLRPRRLAEYFHPGTLGPGRVNGRRW